MWAIPAFSSIFEGNKFYYHEIEGFKVIDKSYGEVGILKEVINQAVQPLFAIEKEDKEVLIPIADSIIDKLIEKKNVFT